MAKKARSAKASRPSVLDPRDREVSEIEIRLRQRIEGVEDRLREQERFSQSLSERLTALEAAQRQRAGKLDLVIEHLRKKFGLTLQRPVMNPTARPHPH